MAEKNEESSASLRSRFNWLVWPVAIIGLLAAAIYAWQRYQYDHTHIVTDNAQVHGQMIKILAPERGFLTNVSVQENQPVVKGETLAKLENEYYQLEVQRAQAKLDALVATKGAKKSSGEVTGGLAQAKLATAQANLEVIKAELAEAQNNADQAKSQLDRMQGARTSQSFVQSQLDTAKANSDQANARLLTLQKEALAAEQQVQETLADGQLLDYNIQQAKAELAQAKLNLASTEIKSPIDGHIAQLQVYAGRLVEQGEYLMTVVSDDDKWLIANIKETKFEQLVIGDLVDINIDAFPGTDFKGVVASFSPAAGNQFSIIPRNYASGNFIKVEALIPVLIRFTEPMNEIEKLVPGMSAEVRIDIEFDRKGQPGKEPKKPAAPDNTTGKTAAPDNSGKAEDEDEPSGSSANGQ